jgi:hypothetical protein
MFKREKSEDEDQSIESLEDQQATADHYLFVLVPYYWTEQGDLLDKSSWVADPKAACKMTIDYCDHAMIVLRQKWGQFGKIKCELATADSLPNDIQFTSVNKSRPLPKRYVPGREDYRFVILSGTRVKEKCLQLSIVVNNIYELLNTIPDENGYSIGIFEYLDGEIYNWNNGYEIKMSKITVNKIYNWNSEDQIWEKTE